MPRGSPKHSGPSVPPGVGAGGNTSLARERRKGEKQYILVRPSFFEKNPHIRPASPVGSPNGGTRKIAKKTGADGPRGRSTSSERGRPPVDREPVTQGGGAADREPVSPRVKTSSEAKTWFEQTFGTFICCAEEEAMNLPDIPQGPLWGPLVRHMPCRDRGPRKKDPRGPSSAVERSRASRDTHPDLESSGREDLTRCTHELST